MLASLLARTERVVVPPEAQFFLDGLAASSDAGPERMSVFVSCLTDHWRLRLWELPRELPTQLAAHSPDPAAIMAELARAYATSIGREEADVWVDHTPVNIGYATTLFDEFPMARMIHIVRDPRAVVASLLPLDWGPSSPRAAARWWLSRLAMGLAAEEAFPNRVIRVNYESLVREPRASMECLCPKLSLTFEPAMAERGGARLTTHTLGQHALVGQPPDLSRIDAWRTQLSNRQVAAVEGELGDLPSIFGYDAAGTTPVVTTGSSAREFLTASLLTARQRLRYRYRVHRSLKRLQPHDSGQRRGAD